MAFVEFEQRGHVGLITINRPDLGGIKFAG